jgi:hypothetical protein
MLSADDFLRQAHDFALNPQLHPRATLVAILQDANSTEVYALVKMGPATGDPKIQLIAIVRIADLPQRPLEKDQLLYDGSLYNIVGVQPDQHGHASLSCRLLKGAGARI